MKILPLLIVSMLIAACATSGEQEDRDEETAIADFIEVNELASIDSLRIMRQLSSKKLNDRYVIVSAQRDDFLLEYYTRCQKRHDGVIEPDYRKDPRALYPKADTFGGCRIKAIYALEPGQADELRQIGRSVGAGGT